MKKTVLMRNNHCTVHFISIFLFVNFYSFHLNAQSGNLNKENIKEMVSDAYFHFFPLVENYKAIYAFSVLEDSPKYLPMNVLSNESKLYTPDDKFVVSPNNDTFYSTANLDLRAEPIILEVPEIKDRYYSFQFISWTTDNFAYVGTNTTGTDPGIFAITAPGFDGSIPDGVKEIKAPSDFIGLIGRTQVNVSEPADIQKARAIQSQYELKQMSKMFPDYEAKEVARVNFPSYSPEVMQNQKFFEILNFLLEYIEPSQDEKRIIQKYEVIGVQPGKEYSFFANNPDYQAVILEGIKIGWDRVIEESKKLGEVKNGWTMYPLGEYFGSNYVDRTRVAKIGIYANSPFEAFYPIAFVDDQGKILNGKHSYRLTFEKGNFPPAKFFWSLTMYDSNTQLLSENKLKRYSIGDRTKNLHYGPNGSLTIYLSAESPEVGVSNWLPAPNGEFNVMMRIYGPEKSVLEGEWIPPVIEKIKN